MQKGQRDAADANLDVLARERDKTFRQFHRRKRAEARRGAEAGRRLAREARQGQAEIGADEPDQPHRRHGLWPLGHHHRTGRGRRRELMRIVPEGAALGDRSLSRQPGRRLRQGGTKGGGEDRILPLHPLRRLAGDGERGFPATPSPNPRRSMNRSRRVEGADGQDLRRRAAARKTWFFR